MTCRCPSGSRCRTRAGAADTGGALCRLAAIGAQPGDQLFQVVRGHRLPGDDHHWIGRDQRHRLEIAQRIERQSEKGTGEHMRRPAAVADGVAIRPARTSDGCRCCQSRRRRSSNHDVNWRQRFRQQRAASSATSSPKSPTRALAARHQFDADGGAPIGAHRRREPAGGVSQLRKATGADIVLIDPQYAPKVLRGAGATAIIAMIAETARDTNVNLFRRYELMRRWREVEQLAFDKFHLAG